MSASGVASKVVASDGAVAAAPPRRWIDEFRAVLDAAAQGDLEARVDECADDPEAATLGRSLNHLLDLTDAFVRETIGALDAASRGRFFRRVLRRGLLGTFARAATVINGAVGEMELQAGAITRARTERLELATKFETAIRSAVCKVAESAVRMRANAEQQAESSREAAKVATTVASASEETASNVRTVAAATEELTASAKEIAAQVERASAIVRETVEQTDRTARVLADLTTASVQIGDMVKLISDIASQTNLLALNATIESAHAGDAGRGFAVVASEVKSLARETVRATELIAAQIAAIRTRVAESDSTMRGVTQTIGQMNDISTMIAAAVTQQGAATQEISRNLQHIASGSQEVSSHVGRVMSAAHDVSAAATEMLGSADGLSHESVTLTSEVDRFLAKVRSQTDAPAVAARP